MPWVQCGTCKGDKKIKLPNGEVITCFACNGKGKVWRDEPEKGNGRG